MPLMNSSKLSSKCTWASPTHFCVSPYAPWVIMTVDGPKIEGSITQVMALLALIMAHLIFIGSYVRENDNF